MATQRHSLTIDMSTQQLELVPASLELIQSELHSHESLASLLNVQIPEGWPPGEYDRPAIEFFRSRLIVNPENVGWYGWYAILPANGSEPASLVGAGGFFGPPTADRVVEIGYSIMPAHRCKGYATEMVRALMRWAFSTGRANRIIAHTTPDNVGSVKVLEKAGFRRTDPGRDPATVEYECTHQGD